MTRKQITAAIRKELKHADWECRVEHDEDEDIVRADLDLDAEFCDRCDLVLSVKDEDVLAMGMPRITVKPSFREAVATYCTRVNFGLRYGKLVLSLEDGEIRYEYLLNAAAFAIDPSEAVTDIVSTVCAVLERALPPVYMIQAGVWSADYAADAYRDSFKAAKKDDEYTCELHPRYCRITTGDYICPGKNHLSG